MTYSEAVFILLANYMTIFVTPHRLLSRSFTYFRHTPPLTKDESESSLFKTHRQSATAHTELRRYLEEMKEQKETELRQRKIATSKKRESILGRLIIVPP